MMSRLLTALTAVLLATAAACVDAPVDTVDVTEATEALSWSDTSSRPSFELWKSGDGQYRFHLADARGATLVTSQGYGSRTAALTGLLSVLANGADRTRYDVRANAAGGAYFNLRAVQGVGGRVRGRADRRVDHDVPPSSGVRPGCWPSHA